MADDDAAPNGEKGESESVRADETVIAVAEATPADADDEAGATGLAEVADIEDPEVEDSDIEEFESEGDDAADSESDDDETAAPVKPRMSHVRLATIVGLVTVLALAGLVGWLGFRAYQSHHTELQRSEFLAAGRQGAMNLTNIDFEHVDADVKRVLDSATGTFYDDFERRSQSFSQVVKEVKSKSVGTVEAAAVESASANDAQVLVAVSVNASVGGQPAPRPKQWRMRVVLQRVGDQPKVSKVVFVP